LNARQTRWLEVLSDYDFDIKSIKGKENKVVDALNKRVHEMHAVTISMCRIDLNDRILEAIIVDLYYAQVKESLQQNNVQHKYKYYNMEEDGILLFKDTIYVPNTQELRNMVLKEMHNVPYVGHPWYHNTIIVVRSEYIWSGMKKDVADCIARYMEC
jgi:hypothetical protein